MRSHIDPETSPIGVADLPLFRHTDGATSREAAALASSHLSAHQARVLAALHRHGPLSGRQLERLPELVHLAPSTVRKRCTDLARLGKIWPCGVERESGKSAATVWKVV